MYRIVTTYKDDSVPFVVHDISAFNMEHCRILAYAIVNRHFGDIPLELHEQRQGRFKICSQGRWIGGVGFGMHENEDAVGTQTTRI